MNSANLKILWTVCLWLTQAIVAQAPLSADDGRTGNFVVQGPWAQEAANRAESVRRQLSTEWLGYELPAWKQPAKITIDGRAGIDPLTGGGATSYDPTTGTQFSGTWQGTRQAVLENVIPHEVLHMVLATHFGQDLPRWYDEGAAVAVESLHSQQFHHRELVQVLLTGRGIPFNRMVALRDYPHDVMAFYSQSHSVACYLLSLRGPREYVRFGELALETGYWSRALQKVYGIKNLDQLQINWNQWVASGGQHTTAKFTFQQGRWRRCPSQGCWIARQPPHCQPRQPDRVVTPVGGIRPIQGARQLTAEQLRQLSDTVTRSMLTYMDNHPQRFRGPKGEPGQSPPLEKIVSTVVSRLKANKLDQTHIVIVADQQSRYWRFLQSDVERTQETYHGLSIAPPPDDFSIGTLPKLVVYSGKTPVITYSGLSDVRKQLFRIRQGELN